MNSIEKAISEEINRQLELDENVDAIDLRRKIVEIHDMLCLISSLIVIRQDVASESAKIAPETLRRHERSGNIQSFSSPGSRLIFYSLKELSELKPLIRGKARRKITK